MALSSSTTLPYVSLSSIPAPTASACVAGSILLNPPFNSTGCSTNNINNHTLAMQACCAGAPVASFGDANTSLTTYEPSGDQGCFLYCNTTTESTRQLSQCLVRLGVGNVECSGDLEKPDDPSYVGSTAKPPAAAATSTSKSSMSTSATATAASATPTGGASAVVGSKGIGKGAVVGIAIVALGSVVVTFA